MGIKSQVRLGVNIDHVATLRNARGSEYPDPLYAAKLAHSSGAEGITVHLREDRRHIRDEDVYRIKQQCELPLNLEMAATDEMVTIALDVKPNACCIVPENRVEITTEGGLDVINQVVKLRNFIQPLKDNNIRVSLFIDAEAEQVKAASDVGADIVEFHTGTYSHAFDAERMQEKMPTMHSALRELMENAQYAHSLGLEVHAGHGLTFDNVKPIAAIPEVKELNIGHFLIAQAVFMGLEDAITTMKHFISEARMNG